MRSWSTLVLFSARLTLSPGASAHLSRDLPREAALAELCNLQRRPWGHRLRQEAEGCTAQGAEIYCSQCKDYSVLQAFGLGSGGQQCSVQTVVCLRVLALVGLSLHLLVSCLFIFCRLSLGMQPTLSFMSWDFLESFSIGPQSPVVLALVQTCSLPHKV